MKVHYSSKDDILTVELEKGKIDDSFETKNMIVHVDKKNKPLLLDIFKASKFLKELNKNLPFEVKNTIFV